MSYYASSIALGSKERAVSDESISSFSQKLFHWHLLGTRNLGCCCVKNKDAPFPGGLCNSTAHTDIGQVSKSTEC